MFKSNHVQSTYQASEALHMSQIEVFYKINDVVLIKMKSYTIDVFAKNEVQLMFSKKATKIDDLTLRSKCQIESEDVVDFCGLLRTHEL